MIKPYFANMFFLLHTSSSDFSDDFIDYAMLMIYYAFSATAPSSWDINFLQNCNTGLSIWKSAKLVE